MVPASVILAGDSLAFQLGPVLRSVAKAHGVTIAVAARGGSSVRQWLIKKWMERALTKNLSAHTVLISLGVNATRVERPRLLSDIQLLLAILNEPKYARDGAAPRPVWLLPPPLGVDTSYLRDAVMATGVFCCFAPENTPLESDKIHPTLRGRYLWSRRIAETLWE
jgi:hypothetical protein